MQEVVEKAESEGVANEASSVVCTLATVPMRVSGPGGDFNHDVTTLPDTGSSSTILPYLLVGWLRLTVTKTPINLRTANGGRMDASGTVRVLLRVACFSPVMSTAVVLRDAVRALLSLHNPALPCDSGKG